MIQRPALMMLVAAAVLSGCASEERHDYEAAANALQAERNNMVECFDCPLDLGNGVTVPLS